MDKTIIDIKNKIYDSYGESTNDKVTGFMSTILLACAFLCVGFSFFLVNPKYYPNSWIITMAIICVLLFISLIIICVLTKRICNLRYYALAVYDTYMKTMKSWPLLEGEKVLNKLKHNNHMAYEECKSLARKVDVVHEQNVASSNLIGRMSYILFKYIVCSDDKSRMKIVQTLDMDINDLQLDQYTQKYLNKKSVKTVRDLLSRDRINCNYKRDAMEALRELHAAYELYPFLSERFSTELLRLYDSVHSETENQEINENIDE